MKKKRSRLYIKKTIQKFISQHIAVNRVLGYYYHGYQNASLSLECMIINKFYLQNGK